MAVCSVALVASCDKDDINGVVVPEGAMALSAEGQGNNNKAAVNMEYVYWVDGESLKINGMEYSVLVAGGGTYTNGAVPEAETYYGYYPSTVAPAVNGGAVSVPARYASSFNDGRQVIGLPMAAYHTGATTEMLFKNLTAGMHVEVTNSTAFPVYLDSVRVVSATQRLNGSVTPDFSADDLGIAAATTETASERMVTVTFENEAVSIAVAATQNVQVPILPIASAANDLTVEVYTHSKANLVYREGLAPANVDFTFSRTKSAPALGRNQLSRAAVTLTDGGEYITVTDHSLFTVASGRKVRFSQGNLKYTSGTWSFHTNQYDYLGGTSHDVSESGSTDLFGWVGASSNFTGVDQYGVTTSDQTDNVDGYGNVATESLKFDWGTLAISNGGNTASSGWRTLTGGSDAEWQYLFDTRTASTVGATANARYAKAYLFGTTHGVILFPDNYIHPTDVAAPTGINTTGNTSWDANTYTAEDWAKMEAAGAVFLPAAGGRNASSVLSVGSYGYYWSSSPNPSSVHYAYSVYFLSDYLNPAYYNYRNLGRSVRLVCPVE